MDKENEYAIARAAQVIVGANALMIAAGAGMGVDSGLPDFRGPEGFWNAYPAYRHLGLNFIDLANPRWFAEDPALAWGFYGHRMHLYRETEPHAGFQILHRWAERMKGGAFVFTSNVDGHFQRSGFPESHVHEVHGSIRHAQCLKRCGAGIFSSADFQVQIDKETFRCVGDLPKCPRCGGSTRPNILMFGDYGWESERSSTQERFLLEWVNRVGGNLAIIEMGAGLGVPTVRGFCEHVAGSLRAPLIRINVREPEVPPGGISISLGALAALQAIDAQLGA